MHEREDLYVKKHTSDMTSVMDRCQAGMWRASMIHQRREQYVGPNKTSRTWQPETKTGRQARDRSMSPLSPSWGMHALSCSEGPCITQSRCVFACGVLRQAYQPERGLLAWFVHLALPCPLLDGLVLLARRTVFISPAVAQKSCNVA